MTFSQPMRDGSWVWSTASKETFPQTTGKPSYMQDHRTGALPVKLEPGKTYAIWLNSPRFRYFRGKRGTSRALPAGVQDEAVGKPSSRVEAHLKPPRPDLGRGV